MTFEENFNQIILNIRTVVLKTFCTIFLKQEQRLFARIYDLQYFILFKNFTTTLEEKINEMIISNNSNLKTKKNISAYKSFTQYSRGNSCNFFQKFY